MSSLLSTLRGREASYRADGQIGLDEWASYFNFGGLDYPYASMGGTLVAGREETPSDFVGMAQSAYKSNGIVFSCMMVRAMLFAEARFQWRRFRNGRPGEMWGNQDLLLLEKPWMNGTTGDLLSRMIQDVDLAGNFYATVMSTVNGKEVIGRTGQNPRIRRLRPDWVTIIMGSRVKPEDPNVKAWDLAADVIGYLYRPPGVDPVSLMPWQVAHFAPSPDPIASYRGMSWLTPVVREIMSDGAMTTHKMKYFEHGATPNMVISLDPTVKREAFEQWIELFEDRHAGYLNAYKTLYLGGGSDAKIIGNDLRQIDFKTVQGAGETRIAAAAGVPPVIAGFSEGLQAATYANYSQARRRFSDGTMRPLWRFAASALATLVNVPSDSELWYDDRDIAFLQEDMKDEAAIKQTQAQTIRSLIDAGYRPESVVAAIQAGDFGLLVHTGLYSVQLQPPGASFTPSGAPAANGNGSALVPAGK